MTVAAIVLAGGRSARFGRDKLAEPVDGRPLLHRAIDAVRPAVDDILVVVAPGASPDLPPGVRVVQDDAAFEGPLAGTATGLRSTGADVVLIVGGDAPSMVPAVLRLLIGGLADPAVEAVVLAQAGGSRPLPIAVRRVRAATVAGDLVATGERRLRALPAGLTTAVITEADWRSLDPDGLTLRDVDVPADLE